MKGEFQDCIGVLVMHVSESRDSYETKAKKLIPFVFGAHDGWDSMMRKMLGITTGFHNPVQQECIRVPLGLVPLLDGSSEATVNQIYKVLINVGILPGDVYKVVNDTENTALKVDKMKGTCAMHTTQLIMQRATGKRTRSKAKWITDSFPECEALRKKAKKAAAYLMNMKAKGRHVVFTAMMKAARMQSERIEMPNETVSGSTDIHGTQPDP